MAFSPDSIIFIVFLFVVVLTFHALQGYKTKLAVIVIANVVFYISFGLFYFFIHLLLVALAYTLAIFAGSMKQKKVYKIAAASLLLLPLLLFKTGVGELVLNLSGPAATGSWTEAVQWVPVGLSFYTFTLVGYVSDVYNGYVPPEKNLFRLLAFAGYFPTILAGPIERSRSLLKQLKGPFPETTPTQINQGILWLFWGIFKKKVIANNIAFVINPVFADPASFSGFVLYVTALLFVVQIFADFSAYSDIATGAASMMGIRVMPNFHPAIFASPSRNIYWKQWHISLTTWFRDYVYYPLSKGKKAAAVLYFNLVFVFLLTGLWHGLSSAFILWGVLNGLLLTGEQWFIKWRKKRLPALEQNRIIQALYFGIGILITFHFSAFFGILFRMETLANVINFMHAFGNRTSVMPLSVNRNIAIISFALVAMAILTRKINAKNPYYFYWLFTNKQIWIVIFLLISLILYLGYDGKIAFYYFRF